MLGSVAVKDFGGVHSSCEARLRRRLLKYQGYVFVIENLGQ